MDNKKTSLIIRSILEMQGKTITNMIEELHINKNFMYSLENGTKPSIENIEKVAEYLGISIDKLLGKEEENISIGNQNIIGNYNVGNKNYYKNNQNDEITNEIIKELQELEKIEKVEILKNILEIKKNKM